MLLKAEIKFSETSCRTEECYRHTDLVKLASYASTEAAVLV